MTLEICTASIGAHRGAPRLYRDNDALARVGFVPGAAFEVQSCARDRRVTLRVDRRGDRRVSAKRRASGKVVPVVDVSSSSDLAALCGVVRVQLRMSLGVIVVAPEPAVLAQIERLERVLGKIRRGEELAMASLAHGAGIMSHAAHRGMAAAGRAARLALANEVSVECVDQARAHNDAWSPATMAANLPMQDLAASSEVLEAIGRVDVMEVGIPCSGASRAGRAKRGAGPAEQHPDVGHLIVAILSLVQRLQPAAAVFECVPPYANSVSAELLRRTLAEQGYDTVEGVIDGVQWGCLEDRERWVMVAVTRGVDFRMPQPEAPQARVLGDVLETVADDDARWQPMLYLFDKAERDAANGNNFKMQTLDASATRVPTIRKGYYKGGSTDPLVKHPHRPGLLRKFTVGEHAAIKGGVPTALVEGLPPSQAHQMLGQSVLYGPFVALFERLGVALTSAADGTDVVDAATGRVCSWPYQRMERATGQEAASVLAGSSDAPGAQPGLFDAPVDAANAAGFESAWVG